MTPATEKTSIAHGGMGRPPFDRPVAAPTPGGGGQAAAEGQAAADAGLKSTPRSPADVALVGAVARHLTDGGDERLHLVPVPASGGMDGGVNKYHCPPRPVPPSTVLRSSCTCSPPSPAGFEAACSCLQALWGGNLTAEQAFGDVRRRLSAALGITTAHHVVLHPSGTDAEFTALLVGVGQARRLGCSGLVNVVVGTKEVGSNTAAAAGGLHFSRHVPVGAASAAGLSPVAVSGAGLRDGVRVVELAARDDDGSVVPDFDGLVLRTLDAVGRRPTGDGPGDATPFIVMHAVDGSKLGSHITSRALVEQIRNRYGERVLFVLDACQARTEAAALDWYLSRGAVVLVTASKFYGAPGFCAAALVPHMAAAAAGQLGNAGDCAGHADHADHADTASPAACGLGSYITQLEVPAGLAVLRSALPAGPPNVGLLLRWSCGVAEMERFARAGAAGRQAIARWVQHVRTLVRAREPRLQLLWDGGCGSSGRVCTVLPAASSSTFVGGVNSIVSFGVLRPAGAPADAGARPLLPAAELRRIHRWLTMDMSARLPASATDAERRTARRACFVGQPVDLGGVAVLRLAIGAPLASDLAEGHRMLQDVLADDKRVLDKIQLAIQYWDVLEKEEV